MHSQSYFNTFPDSTEAAELIVPLVLDVVDLPRSVVDLGGGVGTWSRAFKRHGVNKVTCIDSGSIDRSELLVSENEFMGADLSASIPAPIDSDLAVSLEFAEHVPAQRSSQIVEFLTSSASIVLFSAAIPGQFGPGHINEQPAGYWRKLFREYGYRHHDVIRPRIICRREVPFWYRQNLSIYANEESSKTIEARSIRYGEIPDDFELIHEQVLDTYRSKIPLGLRRWLRMFPSAFKASFFP